MSRLPVLTVSGDLLSESAVQGISNFGSPCRIIGKRRISMTTSCEVVGLAARIFSYFQRDHYTSEGDSRVSNSVQGSRPLGLHGTESHIVEGLDQLAGLLGRVHRGALFRIVNAIRGIRC